MPRSTIILFLFIAVLAGRRATGQQISITRPDGRQLSLSVVDSTIRKLMDAADVTGLCLGMVHNGKIVDVQAYGYKNKALNERNDTATCFDGASFSKAVFAYLVMQLADQRLIDLDKPLYSYLPKPLPGYELYRDLAGDDRWKLLTARQCLDHSAGFPNWRQFSPKNDNKLAFFFTPGERYAYSGEGIYLLQLVVETITGKPLELLARKNIFEPLGMRRTSYLWQPAFETDYALGHLINEDTLPKSRQKTANAAGSLETTIADYTRFVAAVLRGDGLSAKSRQEMLSPQIAILSRHEFPSLDTTTNPDNRKIGLSYGLGWGLFTSPYGKVFFKEGHNDGWEHYVMGLPDQKDAVVLMTNSSNGESIFKELVEKLTGITIPWDWEGFTPYRATVKVSPKTLQEYAGNYVGKYNAYFKVVGSRLEVESPDANLPLTKIYASNDRHFFLRTMDVELDFTRGPNGKVTKVAVNDEGERYDLIRVKDTALDAGQLNSYRGTYEANADHRIVVTVRNGKLFAAATNPKDHLPRLELHAFSETDFYLKEAALKFRFIVGADGRVGKMITYGSPASIGEWRKVE